MTIQTTVVTQSANEILDKKETKLHYLIITNKKGEKMTISIGEKTHNQVQALLKEEEPTMSEKLTNAENKLKQQK